MPWTHLASWSPLGPSKTIHQIFQGRIHGSSSYFFGYFSIVIGVLSSLLEVSNMINNRGYTHQSNFFLLKDPPNKETYSLADFLSSVFPIGKVSQIID